MNNKYNQPTGESGPSRHDDKRKPQSGERRSYGGERRGPAGDKPQSGERRSYGGERRGPAGDKPQFGERRSYGGERRGPAGEKPQFGERRSYGGERRGPAGDKPQFGERRSYGGERRPTSASGKPFERKPFNRDQQKTAVNLPSENDQLISKVAEPNLPIVPVAQTIPELPKTSVLEPGEGLPDRLEGRNPILEAIKAGRAINKLWIAKRDERPEPALSRLIALAREAGAVIMEVDRRALDAMSTTHSHQGVIAQVAAHEYMELDELIRVAKDRQEDPFLLILAELQESYNLGSILRIADSAGVHGVIIPTRRSVGLDAAVAKASAGAIEHVPVARVGNLTQTILTLKKEGFWIAGTDADGKIDYHKADWHGPLAILIGSEGEGLSPILRRHCDFLVSIPMFGKVNSLNAAVAAGIITFEAAAVRRSGTKSDKAARPPLSETDIADLPTESDLAVDPEMPGESASSID